MSDKQQESGANAVGHNSVASAILTAIYDQFSKKGSLPPLPDDVRVDGKVCLITGSNTGLGKATAVEMAKRGAHVLMACRGGHPDAGEDVKRLSGSDKVEMLKVDLSDMDSVVALSEELAAKNIKLDITILNAGLMPLNARRSKQGYELMFAVHFLANRLFVSRCIDGGVIDLQSEEPSRLIFVSSEAHQSSDPIDFDRFGKFEDFGIKDGMRYYGLSKLHMSTLAKEVHRQTNRDGKHLVVSSLCPGPIASSIAREAPVFMKPIVTPIMSLFFNSPEKACAPVVLMACTEDSEQFKNVYLHMFKPKSASPHAESEESGQRLWQQSEALLKDFLPAS